MNKSASIERVSASLLAAQKNIGAATKGSNNPFFKSKYADLGSVMEACKDALNNEGIAVLQPVQSDGSGDYVETVLLHSSGEYISSNMRLVLVKQDMQSYGSAVSYARRYSLQSLMFIPAEDDDGESSMNRVAKTFVKKESVSNEQEDSVESYRPPASSGPAASPSAPRSPVAKTPPKVAPSTHDTLVNSIARLIRIGQNKGKASQELVDGYKVKMGVKSSDDLNDISLKELLVQLETLVS